MIISPSSLTKRAAMSRMPLRLTLIPIATSTKRTFITFAYSLAVKEPHLHLHRPRQRHRLRLQVQQRQALLLRRRQQPRPPQRLQRRHQPPRRLQELLRLQGLLRIQGLALLRFHGLSFTVIDARRSHGGAPSSGCQRKSPLSSESTNSSRQDSWLRLRRATAIRSRFDTTSLI